ncbi:MAG: glycosyltransferase family 4 protein [Nitrospira sp.]
MNWWIGCYWHEPDAPQDPVGLVRIWALADALVAGGEQVTVFAPRYRSALMRRRASVIPIPMLPLRGFRPISYAIAGFLAGLWAGLRAKPSVIYYRWMESPHPIVLAKLFGAACICEINGEPVPPWQASGWKSGLTHALAGWALRRCDRVVTLTDGLARLVTARYGVDTARLSVLPSGSDLKAFRPLEKAFCRREANLDPTGEYIGFVGTFYRYQGLDTLLHAFARIRASRPAARLVLVGDGEESAALRQQADRLGLAPFVIWTGRVPYEQVPLFIGAMDVCVAPFRGGRGETSPVKLFDYLACGKPVVASAIPSVTNLFSPATGVVFVEPDRDEALADVLGGLLADPDHGFRLGQVGRAAVEQRFGWDGIAAQLREVVAAVDRTTKNPGTQPPPTVAANNAGGRP